MKAINCQMLEKKLWYFFTQYTYRAAADTEKKAVTDVKPFYQNFDPTLVRAPRAKLPDYYKEGKHPFWKSYTDGVPDQLIDPNFMGGRVIAYWDTSLEKPRAKFYGQGYFIWNERDPYDFDFYDDPNCEPYKLITVDGKFE